VYNCVYVCVCERERERERDREIESTKAVIFLSTNVNQ